MSANSGLQIGHTDKLPAKNGKSNLLRKYIDCCFFKILSCHSVYLSHAILSRRSFVAALILRLSFVARSFVARSNVVDSPSCQFVWSCVFVGLFVQSQYIFPMERSSRAPPPPFCTGRRSFSGFYRARE
jgi:hypothetical protein